MLIQNIHRGISHVSYRKISGQDDVIMGKIDFFITDFCKLKDVDSENARKKKFYTKNYKRTHLITYIIFAVLQQKLRF